MPKMGGPFPFDERLCLDWRDLSPYWAWGLHIAQQRREQKESYSTHHAYSDFYEENGVLSEINYSLETGKPFDHILRAAGDNGADFGGTNIKGSLVEKAHHLIEFIDPKHWADTYVLGVIDRQRKMGCLAGWATREEIQNAEIVNFKFGDRRAIHCSKLHSMYSLRDVVHWAARQQRRCIDILERSIGSGGVVIPRLSPR